MIFRIFFVYLIVVIFGNFKVYSQRNLTLDECEVIFRNGNLELLAQKFNISAAKANEIQSKIWDLPYLTIELNAINPQNKKYFDIGDGGQLAVAIQQLIYLGGKKSYLQDLAKSNTEISELQFEQLLRNLKNQLHISFFDVYFLEEKINGLQIRLSSIDSLIESYTLQTEKGNLSLKDLVRLQSLALSYTNELIESKESLLKSQNNLQLLLNLSENIKPIVDIKNLNQLLETLPSKSLEELQSLAFENNIDAIIHRKQIASNEIALNYQKSLSIPDLNLGLSYDKMGGAFENQVNLTFGLSLPFWNTNSGNIQIANFQFEQSKVNHDIYKSQLFSQISELYKSIQLQNNLYNMFNKKINNLEIVYNGVYNNFLKRNISMLEFVDFVESYNQSIISFLDLKRQYILNINTLLNLTNQKEF